MEKKQGWSEGCVATAGISRPPTTNLSLLPKIVAKRKETALSQRAVRKSAFCRFGVFEAFVKLSSVVFFWFCGRTGFNLGRTRRHRRRNPRGALEENQTNRKAGGANRNRKTAGHHHAYYHEDYLLRVRRRPISPLHFSFYWLPMESTFDNEASSPAADPPSPPSPLEALLGQDKSFCTMNPATPNRKRRIEEASGREPESLRRRPISYSSPDHPSVKAECPKTAAPKWLPRTNFYTADKHIVRQRARTSRLSLARKIALWTPQNCWEKFLWRHLP